jgi:hypothetical protein
MTLLENLFMSRTRFASGSDSARSTSLASAGTLPSRTLPRSFPPVSLHSQRSTDSP